MRLCWSTNGPSIRTKAKELSMSSTNKTKLFRAMFELGARHDGLRVIEDGLNVQDRVVVNGLQHVQPGATVETKLVDMQDADKAGRFGGGADHLAIRQYHAQDRRNPEETLAMLARFFIDRPVLAWVISLVIVLFGVIAAALLPIAEYPEISPPTVQVTARYPAPMPR